MDGDADPMGAGGADGESGGEGGPGDDSRPLDRFRFGIGLTIISLVILPFLVFGYVLIGVSLARGEWKGQALEHFPAIVGLPVASAVALLLVLILKATSGPIEFEGLGFKFRGASGPLILWLLLFLGITGAIHLLWPVPR